MAALLGLQVLTRLHPNTLSIDAIAPRLQFSGEVTDFIEHSPVHKNEEEA
jgi:hypothetical protein